jgi:putative flippase GtrA
MMDKTKNFTYFLYQHHLVRYIFVGGTTFILDFGLLVILHQRISINLAVATSIAYWLSIIYNFILNRQWTFSVGEKEKLRKHLSSYLILLGFNYLFTVVSVSLLSHIMYFGLAKVLAVAAQVTWTYPIYKNVIFTKEES